VAAHSAALTALGHVTRPVKTPGHLAGCAALVLPGGESTTMLKLLRDEGLLAPLEAFCRSGAPVLGTCAGAILLARGVTSPEQPSLGVLDIDVERNAYGRQLDSFVALADEVLDPALRPDEPLELVFIRAPIIRRTGPGVEVLVRHAGHPVAVRQGPVFASTFHPELSADPRLLARALDGLAA
jgi:5'-phosphate synthase pdxT subunit